MLSRDLKELSDTFESWCSGGSDAFPTVEAWAAFRRDLKTCVAKSALLEFGIDVKVVDIAAAVAEPDSNIMLFPTPAQRSQSHEARHDR